MGNRREFDLETEANWQYHLTWAGNIVSYLKEYGSPFKEDYLSELGELDSVVCFMREIVNSGYWERDMNNSERSERGFISLEEEYRLTENE